jgi:hypothetical protein
MHKDIDVHLCRFGNYDTSMYDQCMESLHKQSDLINIHFVDDVAPLSEARKHGFGRGVGKYVCHVDVDDYVLPGAFEVCLHEIEHNPTPLVGVYTNSLILDPEHNTQTPFFRPQTQWTRQFHISTRVPVHQLCIMKRSVVERVHQKIISEYRIEQHYYTFVAEYGDLKLLTNVFGYVWRRFPQGNHNFLSSEENHVRLLNTKKRVLSSTPLNINNA